MPDLTIIGHVSTPWSRGNCPKNMTDARERAVADHVCRATVFAPFRAGLSGLDRVSHVILLGWFEGRDRETLALHPPHLAASTGVFALRAPDRPNPLGLSIARIRSLSAQTGVIDLDALDWFDGTPLVDIKPYIAATDSVPDAVVGHPRAPAPHA